MPFFDGHHGNRVFLSPACRQHLLKSHHSQLKVNHHTWTAKARSRVLFPVLIENMLRTARPPSPVLTVRDLQQGFGNDTPGDVESLAAVEAAIRVLNVGDGQTTRLGDREAAEGLRRLVGEEETLGRR